MRTLWNGFKIAVSMFSRIPVPRADWNEKNMRYAFCFFPLIGAVIGAVGYGLAYLLEYLSFSPLFTAAILTAVPVLITGGIHLDGFCDTSDALSSHQPREKKLEILKDSHAGAFAIICCAVYFVLYYGAATQMTASLYAVFAPALIGARALSAFSIVHYPPAKEGLVSMFSGAAEKTAVTVCAVLWFAAAAALSVWLSPIVGAAVFGGMLLAYLCCVAVFFKVFGGISGDLAGWMVQVAELTAILAAVVAQGVIAVC